MIEELIQIAESNGREVIVSADHIETVDRYEGTDRQTFKTLDEALTWEKGYK